MKKFIGIILFVLVSMPNISNAGAVYTTLDDLESGVRNKIAFPSKSLPDSVVTQACKDGLLAVSVEIGGIEAIYMIVTDTNVAFYTIPDSIVEVTKITLINTKRTNSVRAMDPEQYEYSAEKMPTELGVAYGSDDKDVPFTYDIWSDTIQLTPIPNRIDTIYLKCYIEHQNIDSTDTLLLRPAYTEAALWYAASICEDYLRDYETSLYFYAKYEKKMSKLLARYRPKYARGQTQ